MTTRAEAETIVGWDLAGDTARLFTADVSEVRRWRKLGYDVQASGTVNGKPRSWTATVPIGAVALLPIVAGRVKAPRWLEPPVLWDGAGTAQEPREPEKIDENIQQIDVNSPGGERTPTG